MNSAFARSGILLGLWFLLFSGGSQAGILGLNASNDHFADRIRLDSTVPLRIEGCNIEATHEYGVDDPLGLTAAGPGPGAEGELRTLWWEWIPPEDGIYCLNSQGTRIDLGFVVMEGGVGIDPIGMGSFSGEQFGPMYASPENPRKLVFRARAGVPYQILVGGVDGDSGFIRLDLTEAAEGAPSNDDFANRRILPSEIRVTDSEDNSLATAEPEDIPDDLFLDFYPPPRSLWWSWTAPESGRFVVHSKGSEARNEISIFTGNSIDSLVPVEPIGFDMSVCKIELPFDAVSGQTYQFSISQELVSDMGIGGGCQPSTMPNSGRVQINLEPSARNGSFQDRIKLGTSLPATSMSHSAGLEEQGPLGEAVLYWEWQAPADDLYEIDTSGSGGAIPSIEVYLGRSEDNLILVDEGGGSHHLVFSASKDEVIQIFLRPGSDGMLGVDVGPHWQDVHLRIGRAPPAEPNDLFENAYRIFETSRMEMVGSSIGATTEEWIATGQEATVWWKWTAPRDGTFRAKIDEADFVAQIAAFFRPTPIDGLTELDSITIDQYEFEVFQGVEYYFSIGTTSSMWEGDGGNYRITGTLGPPNDDRWDAQEILAGETLQAYNGGATREPGEESHGCSGQGSSVWFEFRPVLEGMYELSVLNPEFNSVLAIYDSDTMFESLPVLSSDPPGVDTSSLVFPATEGARILIAVDSANTQEGSFSLQLTRVGGWRSYNDDFANAPFVSTEDSGPGGFGELTASLAGSTLEQGEPQHAAKLPLGSLWYRWRAPGDGAIRMQASLFSAEVLLAVYTGDDVSSLTEVASSSGEGEGSAELTMRASRGEVYSIALAFTRPTMGFDPVVSFYMAPLNPYDSWVERFNPDGEPPLYENQESPAGDGVTNALKMILGIDPFENAFSSQRMPVLSVHDGMLELTYQLGLDARDDLVLAVDHFGAASPDLRVGPDQEYIQPVALGGHRYKISIPIRDPVRGQPRFLRLQGDVPFSGP